MKTTREILTIQLSTEQRKRFELSTKYLILENKYNDLLEAYKDLESQYSNYYYNELWINTQQTNSWEDFAISW